MGWYKAPLERGWALIRYDVLSVSNPCRYSFSHHMALSISSKHIVSFFSLYPPVDF